MSGDMIFGIVLAWNIIGLCIEGFFSLHMFDGEIINPFMLYEYTSMNWFGCWCVFIFLSIISPIMFVLKIIYVIIVCVAALIVWLFTVGKE